MRVVEETEVKEEKGIFLLECNRVPMDVDRQLGRLTGKDDNRYMIVSFMGDRRMQVVIHNSTPTLKLSST